jgi:putative endonuclease
MTAPTGTQELARAPAPALEPGRTGQWGEDLAARHLERRGWTVIARNYRAGRHEIDLIAYRGGIVAFVEVKARKGERFGNPLEAITAAKRDSVQRVADRWVRSHGREYLTYRFDAIGVAGMGSGKALIQHVEGAWGI